MYDRILRVSVRHPWLVIGATLGITAALAAFIPAVELRLDARSLLPLGEPELQRADEAAARYGARDTVLVGLVAPSGLYRPGPVERLRRLADRLSRVPGIVPGSTLGLSTAPRLRIEGGLLDRVPVLEPEDARDAAGAERLGERVRALGLDDGVLASPDGSAAAIYAEVSPGADRDALGAGVAALAQEAGGSGGGSVHLGGNALAQIELGRASALDLLRVLPAMVGALLVLLWLGYRHPAPALISLVEIGLSLAWTVGLVGLTHHPVFITTLIAPVILLAVGISDDVYAMDAFLARWREGSGLSLEEAVVEGLGEVARPIAFSALTTVGGMLSLMATRLEPLRTFGLFGAAAIGASTLFTFTLVPALLVVLQRPLRGLRLPRLSGSGLLGRGNALGSAGMARPRSILALAALAAAASAAAIGLRLQVDDTWVGNLPASNRLVQDSAALDRALGGTTTVDLSWDAAAEGGFADPATFAELGRVGRALSAVPGVGAVRSVHADALRVLAELSGETYPAYAASLAAGRRTLSTADVQQALVLLEVGGPDRVRSWIDPALSHARMTLFIRGASAVRIRSILDAVEAAAPASMRAVPFGDGWISDQAVRLLVVGQLRSILAAVAVNLVLMWIVLRSAWLAVVASVPTLLSVLVVLALLAAAGIPLGIASSLFTAIGLGLGVDYSIHLAARYRTLLPLSASGREAMRQALAQTSSAIITSAFAVSGAMGVLLLSSSPPNRLLGLLVCASMVVSAALTLVLLPALALVRERAA